MQHIDFHSHHPSREGERVIQDGIDTYGLHPWHVSHEALRHTPLNLEHIHAMHPCPLFIGECGLDHACNVDFSLQEEAFRQQVRLSEEAHLPLLLHCVRATDDVLRIRREERATQPWIWHGFRGKAEMLQSLLRHGFYFSFGFAHRKESILACPRERLLLETDADERPVRLLYADVSAYMGIEEASLIQQMQENLRTLCTHSSL